MLKAWIYRLHRWTALVFALPLIVVFVTGFILALEPLWMAGSAAPRSVDPQRLEAILAKHDPDGKLERLFLYPQLDLVVLGNRGGLEVDLNSGEPSDAPSTLLWVFRESRRIHETLLIDDGHTFVTISTSAMLGLIVLGLLLGPRQLRNTASGWHTSAAWIALPLIAMSPVTGLMMLYKVTFMSPEAKNDASAQALSLADALKVVQRERDVSELLQLRQRKGFAEARLFDNGEQRNYAVTAEGLKAQERNWPKLLHEGNWLGIWSAIANASTALVLMTLWGTGLYVWVRRKRRKRQRVRVPAAAT